MSVITTAACVSLLNMNQQVQNGSYSDELILPVIICYLIIIFVITGFIMWNGLRSD